MKEYFKLQYLMTKRKLSDGSRPIAGYLFVLFFLFVFVGLSIVLFQLTTFAPYIYIFSSLFFTSKLSEIKRNDFLKIHFGDGRYRIVRILENLTVALPFVIFLICKQQFYPAIFLVVITVLMTLLSFKAKQYNHC